MRIRKHARISPLIYTHVCQLNQSPWDVITFPIEEKEDPFVPPPPPPPCSFNYQFDGYADNGTTFYDSNGTVESVTSMERDERNETNNIPNIIPQVRYEINGSKWDNNFESSFTEDICDDVKKIKQDNEDADMEKLGLLMDENNGYKLYNNSTNKKLEKQHEAAVAETGSPRRRPRAKKSSSSSSNPYEFYYYSGFGPLWGKKRGAKRNNATANRKDAEQYSSSKMDNEEFDYVEDEDDDEEGNEKKRPQKPIKARSIKSLM
ncbi:hypothetical protein K7X08_022108 [Anisodus acutangulus]|uniref:Uncharacterized protein n=1 Tax=Anisodus acutangulus TaxID=402998 RepID=A0A9Q1L6G4_9SOLA|nr:hypothetical protein K7X08_022108 [Anisodus acutangulus]